MKYLMLLMIFIHAPSYAQEIKTLGISILGKSSPPCEINGATMAKAVEADSGIELIAWEVDNRCVFRATYSSAQEIERAAASYGTFESFENCEAEKPTYLARHKKITGKNPILSDCYFDRHGVDLVLYSFMKPDPKIGLQDACYDVSDSILDLTLQELRDLGGQDLLQRRYQDAIEGRMWNSVCAIFPKDKKAPQYDHISAYKILGEESPVNLYASAEDDSKLCKSQANEVLKFVKRTYGLKHGSVSIDYWSREFLGKEMNCTPVVYFLHEPADSYHWEPPQLIKWKVTGEPTIGNCLTSKEKVREAYKKVGKDVGLIFCGEGSQKTPVQYVFWK